MKKSLPAYATLSQFKQLQREDRELALKDLHKSKNHAFCLFLLFAITLMFTTSMSLKAPNAWTYMACPLFLFLWFSTSKNSDVSKADTYEALHLILIELEELKAKTSKA